MATYLAFLRAINLGAKRQFPKAEIVRATERAGFTDVATHINTGNVRLRTSLRSRVKIEAALEQAYVVDRGFEVPTIVFSPAELHAIVDDADVLADGYDGRHYVSLLKNEPSATLARVMEQLSSDHERVHVSGRAVHLLLGDAYHQAKLNNASVEKQLGVATNRNLTVIRALVQKWC